jgi:hypothetical protein
VDRFSHKKINEVEDKEPCQVKTKCRFGDSEHLVADMDINRAWGTVRKYIKISAREPRLSRIEGEVSHQRSQTRLQWLRNHSEINRENVTRKASRYFRNKKREYLKDKINEFATPVRTRILETYVEA